MSSRLHDRNSLNCEHVSLGILFSLRHDFSSCRDVPCLNSPKQSGGRGDRQVYFHPVCLCEIKKVLTAYKVTSRFALFRGKRTCRFHENCPTKNEKCRERISLYKYCSQRPTCLEICFHVTKFKNVVERAGLTCPKTRRRLFGRL